MNNGIPTIERMESLLPAPLLRSIASFGYVNRHPENADAIRRAYRELLAAIIAGVSHGKATTTPAAGLIQATQSALGDYPDEIADMMKASSDVLDWLADIFQMIAREVDVPTAPCVILETIRTRAACGQYLAEDFSNLTDCQRKKMESAMAAAGIRRGGAS